MAGGGIVPWIIRANAAGEPEWSRNYEPIGYTATCCSTIESIEQTSDGGYVAAGVAASSPGPSDAWLFKLDPNGNVQWSKTYHGDQRVEGFFQAEPTRDGGYVAVGNTFSFGSPGHPSNGWVLKLDRAGNVVWQEAFGGQDTFSIDQTKDGGFIVAGTVDVDGRAEAWVFKLDREGNISWQKAYAVAARTEAFSIHETQDGGYVVAGHSTLGALVLRLDRTGKIQWLRTLEGSGFTTSSVVESSDHGFVVAGRSSGPYLLKLDPKGNIVWERVYGKPNDIFFQARVARDGGLVVGGYLFTSDSIWGLKLNPEGDLGGCPLGTPSNGPITGSPATVTSPTVRVVSSSATVVQTDVKLIVTITGVKTQCLSVLDSGKRGKNW